VSIFSHSNELNICNLWKGNNNQMESAMSSSILTIGALVLGVVIGYLFGHVQNAALLRNKKRMESGKLKTGWAMMPGSMTRVAMLLVILTLVQLGIPMFFKDNIQWVVSAGIVLGYGWTFVKQLRERSTYRS
jgi:hypothetical protein